MKINIEKKFRIFSFKPGIKMPVPLSLWQVKIFPCRLVFFDDKQKQIILTWCVQGFVEKFCVFYDLEKKKIEVSGQDEKGYFCYEITCDEKKQLVITFKRLNRQKIGYEKEQNNKSVKKQLVVNTPLIIGKNVQKITSPNCEKLFFGCHKALDWQMMVRRKNVLELLPIWHYLSRIMPIVKNKKREGIATLFDDCNQLIKNKQHDKIASQLMMIFRLGFSSFFLPSLIDKNYQSGLLYKISKQADPYSLFTLSKKLIRGLFFQQKKNVFTILPSLPKEIFAGKMMHVDCDGYGTMHFEWSKKQIKKIIFFSDREFSMRFVLSPSIKRFRLQEGKKKKKSFSSSSSYFSVKADKVYYFDRFQR